MFIINNNLNYNSLKEKYPKSIKKLHSWVEGSLGEFQKRIAGELSGTGEVEIPPLTESIIEKATEAMLQTAYRDLFDFFDRNNILIEIIAEWIASVDAEDGIMYNSRVEAEIDGFTRAFAILENK